MTVKKNINKFDNKVVSATKAIQLSKGKTRKEAERFFDKFSGTQLNAIVILILAATFLVQGITRYVELVDKTMYLKPWLIGVSVSLFLLVCSVVFITFDGVVKPLGAKKEMNIIVFLSFVAGVIFFLLSLLYLILVVL